MRLITSSLTLAAAMLLSGCKDQPVNGGGAVSGAEAEAGAGGPAWLTDLPAAQARAKEENKLVFLEFTGSDWCPPCIMLKKEVLTSKEFEEFAREHLVLVEIDFPARKEQSAALKEANEDLARQFDVEGFPTVVLLDGEGQVLKRDVGFPREGAKAYLQSLKKLRQ